MVLVLLPYAADEKTLYSQRSGRWRGKCEFSKYQGLPILASPIIVPLNADDLLKPREESRRYLPDIDLIKIRHQMADTSDDSSFKLRASSDSRSV